MCQPQKTGDSPPYLGFLILGPCHYFVIDIVFIVCTKDVETDWQILTRRENGNKTFEDVCFSSSADVRLI